MSVMTCTGDRAGLQSAAYRAAPSAKLSPTTGMSSGTPNVPARTSVRPGWPSLKMITAS